MQIGPNLVTNTHGFYRKIEPPVFVTNLHTTHHYEFNSEVAYNTRVRAVLNIQGV